MIPIYLYELDSLCTEWLSEQKYEELAQNTLAVYGNAVHKFINWADPDIELTKALTIEYKKFILNETEKISTINTWITGLNKFLKYIDRKDCTIKQIKQQKEFNTEKVLTFKEYKRLERTAKKHGMWEAYYIMRILISTGIRVGELKFFTVEAIQKSNIQVNNKGKFRRVPLRQDTRRELIKYAKTEGIKSGPLFRSGEKPMLEVTVWRKLKKVAGLAKVRKDIVYPHSFRHLFTQIYNEAHPGETLNLADILGHNDLATTRKYTKLSSDQQRKLLEEMKI